MWYVTFGKHEQLLKYAILKTYLNILWKMEISLLAKQHIFHLKLNTEENNCLLLAETDFYGYMDWYVRAGLHHSADTG